MSGQALATYPWIVKPMPGVPLAPSSARGTPHTTAKRAWHGLIQVLIGPDPPSVWRWDTPRERRFGYAALLVVTLALCAANLVGSFAALGQLLLALPAVAPLPLAARYPMLAWRVGWLALLLVPLVPAAWWGGWPWGPGQILAMLGAFCLAGIRQRRPELWWMWALSLIPWCLWLIADLPNLHGPASATIIFTAVVIAVDSIGSRLRAQHSLATQTQRAEAERAQRAIRVRSSRIARCALSASARWVCVARECWARSRDPMLSTAITTAVKIMVALAGPCRFGRSAMSHRHHGMRLSAHIHHSSGRRWRIPARQNAPSMASICPGPHGQPPHQAAGTSGTSSSASQPIRQASIGYLAASGSGATAGKASSSCPSPAKLPTRLAAHSASVTTPSAAYPNRRSRGV